MLTFMALSRVGGLTLNYLVMPLKMLAEKNYVSSPSTSMAIYSIRDPDSPGCDTNCSVTLVN